MKKLLVLVLLPAGFAWGAACVRFNVFPHAWLEAAWHALATDATAEAPPAPLAEGSWERARDDGAAPVDGAELANLPYLAGSQPATDAPGVVYHDAKAAWEGLDLVVSGHAPEATLEDMDGHVLHRWHRALHDVWPGPLPFDEWAVHGTFWRRAHLLPDGRLLAIFEGIGMIELDADSNVVWAYEGRCHHDMYVGDDGRIWTVARKSITEHDALDLDGKSYEDFIVVLSPDGKELRRISLLDAIAKSSYQSLLSHAAHHGDILHTNTIELLDGAQAASHPMWRKGGVLVSFPTLDTVAVVDPETEKLCWALTDLWQFQHEPTVLPDGHLLVFDNRGEFGHSKALEIDPLTQHVVWSYGGTQQRPLESGVCGTVQRLPNGNTLIVETTAGRALEVTANGTVVWEYHNPHRAGEHDKLVASLFEVERLDPGVAPWLDRRGGSAR